MTPEMKKKLEEFLATNVPVMISLGISKEGVVNFVEEVLSREGNIASILYSFGERYPTPSAIPQFPPSIPKALWVDVLTPDNLYEFRLRGGSFRYEVTKLKQIAGLEVEYSSDSAILIVYFEGTSRLSRITASGDELNKLLNQFIYSLRKLTGL